MQLTPEIRRPVLVLTLLLAACSGEDGGGSDTDTDTDSSSESGTDSDTSPDTETGSGDADTDTDTDTDSSSESGTDSDTSPDTGTGSGDADTGTGSGDADTDTDADACAAGEVFVNEIHYDNDGNDAGEAIELAGPAGTDLSSFALVLYNGNNGEVYDSQVLSGTIPSQEGAMGTASFDFGQIQNGAPDGIALVEDGTTVVQFLSYEGTFTAVDGPAAGSESVDIGAEQDSTPVGDTLQLGGTGCEYGDFAWSLAPGTFGDVNTFQVFGG